MKLADKARDVLHTLRHSLRDASIGEPEPTSGLVQVLLGRNNLSSTARRYTQVATHTIRATQSPFDRLTLEVAVWG